MSTYEQDLKSLWQSLPAETVVLTPEEMKVRAVKFQAKHKRRDIIEYGAYVVLLGLVGYVLTAQADWQAWVASGLAVFGGIIAMWNYYRFSGAKALPTSQSVDSLLDFMRRELRRQRDAAASAWRWYILPFTPFIIFVTAFRWVEEGATLTEMTQMRVSILYMTAFVVIFLGANVLWLWLRAARYQRQLDELERY